MRGGKRENAGRKRLKEEEKTTAMICQAIKLLQPQIKTDDEALIALLMRMLSTDNGTKWCAEKVFGKPREVVEQERTEEIVVRFVKKELPKMEKVS